MNILFNVTTRRGIISILPLMKELRTRGHGIYTLVTTHPGQGLRYPHRFMIGENADMLELLDGVSECSVHTSMNDSGDLYSVLVDIAQWGIDLHITKGDSGMERDRILCSGICNDMRDIKVIAQQTDWHMHIGAPWYAEHFLTMGPRWSEYLVAHGVGIDNVTVAGCIKGDYLRTLPHVSDDYITFFSQMDYTEEQKRDVLTTLTRVAADYRKELVIKLHPAWEQYNVDEMSWWKDAAKWVHTTITDYEDPYTLMQNSALVVSAFSNTVYEAMIMGVPAVSINIMGSASLYQGSGIDIYDMDNLYSKCATLLDGELGEDDRDRLSVWQYGQYFVNDGQASVRSANKIEEIYSG